MTTNREKYIDNASNEELARTLATGFYHMRTKINISEKYIDARKWILKWLSKEAKEETKSNFNVKNIDLEKEVIDLKIRVQELEKCNRIAEVKEHIEERFEEETKDLYKNMRPATQEEQNYVYNYMIKNGKLTGININDVDNNKSADQMFEELGYKKVFSNALCEYIKELRGGEKTYFLGNAYNNKKIVINCNLEYWSNIAITEAEDKAIHKKISELKDGLKNDNDKHSN